MATKKEMGNEIFAIRGVLDKGQKVGFLKKWPYQFNAYENGIYYKLNEVERYIHHKDIIHIFRKDNVNNKATWRNLVFFYYLNGERKGSQLSDETFPNIIEKVEELYKNEWKKYSRNYPESVKWFTSVIANYLIVVESPFDVFGAVNDDEDYKEDCVNALKNHWDIHNKSDLIEMCEIMFSCPNVEVAKEFYETVNEDEMNSGRLKVRSAIMVDYERTIKAYDVYRVIILAYLGYTAKYFTFNEAMDWCLKAGKELQKTYKSWDDLHDNYILGYSFWSQEDADVIGTNANQRKRAYEETKKYPTHPWQISWNMALRKEW